MSAFLAGLAPWTSWILGGIVFLMVLVLLYIAWVVLGRTAPEEEIPLEEVDEEAVDSPEEGRPSLAERMGFSGTSGIFDAVISPLGMRRGVRRGYRALREFADTSTYQDPPPWILALGPAGSRKSEALRSIGLPRSLPELTDGPLPWYVFDQGAVIDVPESLILDVDGTADERSWEGLLSALVRYRPERPIDGVTLLIPARTLLTSDPLAHRSPAQELAEVLFARLRRAQSALGLRFPVYVVVTGAEDIAGFDAYVRELPVGMYGDAFGWSTPYSLDSAFQESWIDEAFDDIYGRLTRISTEILATRPEVDDADAIFRFPDHFRELEPRLRSLVASVFRDSAYHEGFFLRGIYFSGARPSTPPEATPPEESTLFVSRLFQRKIFPERGLTTPFRSSLLDRNRKVRWLQITAILVVAIGLPGVWWGHWRLSSNAESIENVLHGIHRSLDLLEDTRRDPGLSISASGADDSVFVALRNMGEIDLRSFRSIFLPTSWVNSADRVIDETLRLGFQKVVLPVLREGLVEWADTVVSYEWAAFRGSPPPSSPANIRLPDGRAAPEAGALEWFILELDSLALGMRRFNQVVASGDIDPFADLVMWYFEDPLPPAFRTRDDFYRRALAEAQVTAITPAARPGFTDRALEVSVTLAEATYVDLFQRLEALDSHLAEITAGRTRYASDDLYRLLEDIDRLERFLDLSASYWLEEGAPFGREVEASLDRMSDSGIFAGPLFALRFRREFQRIRSERLNQLARLPAFTRVMGPGAAPGAAPADLALAPLLDELGEGIRDLLGRGFMNPVHARGESTRPGFGARPRWNPAPLDEVVRLLEEARAYEESQLARFPTSFHAAVREVTRRALDQRIHEGVTAAMTWESGPEPSGRRELEAELGARMASFDEAARRLVRLMEVDESSAGFGITPILAEVLLLEILDLLHLADRILDEARPYQASMGRWNTGRPAAWAAFGVDGHDGLEGYLAQQREVVRTVADRHVARVLGYGTLPPVDRLVRFGGEALGPGAQARLSRWRGIVRALEQYEAAEPGNSLAELERFIRSDLMARTPGECPVERVGGAPLTSDWFVESRERINRAFHQRCAELARIQLEREYGALRSFFQENLAGRAPFVTPEAVVGAPDADPAVVREFLARFDRLIAPLGEDWHDVVATLPGGAAVAGFLRQIGSSRPTLLALLGDPDAPEAAGVGYRVDFRTHRSLERGADQIAEWSLQVGGRRADLGAGVETRTGVWRSGQPVILSLRWATGSPFRPLQDTSGGRVEGGRILHEYRGPWALFRLLTALSPSRQGLAGAGAPSAGSLESGTLLLAIPVAPVDRTGAPDLAPGPQGLTLTYVRIRFLDPDTTAPLSPPTFPAVAPPLAGSTP